MLGFTRDSAGCQGRCNKLVTCPPPGTFRCCCRTTSLTRPIRRSVVHVVIRNRCARYHPCGADRRGRIPSFKRHAGPRPLRPPGRAVWRGARRAAGGVRGRTSTTDRLAPPRGGGAAVPLVDPRARSAWDPGRDGRRSPPPASLPSAGDDLDPVERAAGRHQPGAYRCQSIVRVVRLGRAAQILCCARRCRPRAASVSRTRARLGRRVRWIRGERHVPSGPVSGRGGPYGADLPPRQGGRRRTAGRRYR